MSIKIIRHRKSPTFKGLKLSAEQYSKYIAAIPRRKVVIHSFRALSMSHKLAKNIFDAASIAKVPNA